MAMTRSQFKKQLQLGLNTVAGLEYRPEKDPWRQYLTIETESKRAYIEDVVMSGFQAASVKAEGAAGGYVTASEIYTAKYLFETIVIQFAVTEEAEEDGLYGSIVNKLAKAAMRSMQYTKRVKCANVLNNGFSSSFLGGDGVALFSTAHLGEGQVANMLSTAADLSETSLEDMLILIDNATDYKGIPISIEAQKLIVPTALRFTGHRILNSQGRVETPNNDENAIKAMGLLPGGMVVDKQLTDTDAWFITTDCPDGLKHVMRKALKKGVEGDFETGNMRMKFRERYANGWTDYHGGYGTAGGG
ncbi:MAG: hypothetical protein NUW01_08430 [Gemmatimonadaceae bacterium]|nr:hypothetical protein [Gemmatimonadaceae bacterium]